MAEQADKIQNPDEGPWPVLGKGWNILRFVISNKNFMPKYYDEVETLLKPLFEYIAHPNEIDFEDDILLCIKSLVNKKQEVSPTIFTMIQCFPGVLQKNKCSFQTLMPTINTLLKHGKV